jgi:hypothetical protein
VWLGIVAVIILVVAGGTLHLRSAHHGSSQAGQLPLEATYAVTGTGPAILEWERTLGSYRDPLGPLSRSAKVSTSGSPFASRLSAAPTDNGTATCTISVDGQVLSTQTSHLTAAPGVCIGAAPVG